MNNKFEYKQINSKYIVSDPAYQRVVDMNRVKKMVANFNPNIINPIKVSYRDGKFYVFDGQHTLGVLKLKNNNTDLLVDCKIYKGLTQDDEAELFAAQNGISRTVNTIAKFKALYVAKDIDICSFRDLTESIGIKMNFTNGKADNKIVACTKAYKIYNDTTLAEYVEIMTIIKNAWDGVQESFNTEILGGVYIFYKKYKGQFDARVLEKQLSKVSPISIIREGKVSGKAGDERFARQILATYNKKLRNNRIENEF